MNRMNNTFQAIVTDLDGTLLNRKGEINNELAELLIDYQNNGGTFVIATARHYCQCLDIVKRVCVDRKSYVISSNGCYVYDSNGEIIHRSDLIEASYVRSLLEIKNIDQVNIVTNGTDYVITKKKRLLAIIKSCVVNIRNRNGQKMKIMKSGDLGNRYKDITAEKLILKISAPYDIKSIETNENYIFTHNKNGNIEIVNKNSNKKYALETLLKTININPLEVVAFGDEDDDVEMLSYVGMGVAMKNGSEKAKKVAKYITKTNDEDGVLFALQKET